MRDLERRLSAAQLRLRGRHPFFASLALFAPVHITARVDTAATDGRDIYFNPHFLENLSREELDGVLLHEVLHAALLHAVRRGEREPQMWNYAADIVVNGMIHEAGLNLPPTAVRNREWEDRSVEEVYELLLKNSVKVPGGLLIDLRPELAEGRKQDNGNNKNQQGEGRSLSQGEIEELRAHWRLARQQARVIARQVEQQQGTGAGGMGLDWQMVDEPQIDWRAELWRYLVQTPVDFSGYDRRFVYRGLYVDQMVGESLLLWVAVDTSGSIGDEELNKFLGELQGILRAYPNIRCHLYFADWKLYGPYEINRQTELPKPEGGGGTSFVPFFGALKDCRFEEQPYVCVYLTDGWGEFPEEAPEIPTLWVVVPGGRESDEFPFGRVVRLLGD